MIRRTRDRHRRPQAPGDAAPPPGGGGGGGEASVWTPEKVRRVLAALRSFVGNQATKHGVPAHEVWALVRDEVLDPQGRD
jgi:hypothetical protein